MGAGANQKIKQLYEFGPFRVDPEKELVLRGDETVQLTPKTFQVLLVLMRHSKEIVTKDDLMKMVWPDTFVEEANLSRNIFLLRKALGETPQDHQYILTVPGRGYRFAEDVQLVPERELSIVAASHAKIQVQIDERSNWLEAEVYSAVLNRARQQPRNRPAIAATTRVISRWPTLARPARHRDTPRREETSESGSVATEPIQTQPAHVESRPGSSRLPYSVDSSAGRKGPCFWS
jgi:DNA-binding winged helix-turn-helix (wHTH) protein